MCPVLAMLLKAALQQATMLVLAVLLKTNVVPRIVFQIEHFF
jgi:hypothetical protein